MDEYTKPDYQNIAFITVDVQNDFSLKGAAFEILGTHEVIPNIVRILKRFREENKPIIHFVRIYKEDGSNVDICRKKKIEEGLRIVAPNSEGAEIVKELKPNDMKLDSEKLLNGKIEEIAPNEFVIYKPRWGAFFKTSLESFLKGKNILTLVFAGCNFPNCPRTSIFEASERDFRIVVIEDAISGIYEKGIAELRNICCEVMKTEEFLQKL